MPSVSNPDLLPRFERCRAEKAANVRIIDIIETYRELGSDLMDLYLSSVSQRMTEVMKVLTIVATIFIPLTFISSIYGMNFHTERSPWNMPELT